MLVANLRASPGKSAVLGAGAIVLVILLVRLASGGKPEAADAAIAIVPPATAVPGTMAVPAPRAVVPRRPLPRLRQVPAARDPFSLGWLGASAMMGAKVGEDAPAELVLQLILTAGDQDKGLAVISGQVVHPGSTVGSFEVVEIADRHVVLRDVTGTKILRMP